MAGAAAYIYSMFNNADIKFEDIQDETGQFVALTQGRFITFMESENRSVREAAFKGLYKTYESFQNTVAAMFDANARASAFYAKERHYEDAFSAALDDSEIPKSVYTNLIDAVHENMENMYQYLALRKKALHVDELHLYDIYTPLVPNMDKKYTFEDAKSIVLKGLEPLGEEYCSILKQGFENRWIDIYENEGKRTGAYSWEIGRAHV